MIDREWQDGDDSALYDRGYEDGLESQFEKLERLYADLEWALVEQLDEECPSVHLIETVHDWARQLHAVGVLSDDAWERAQEIVQQAGAMVEVAL